MQWTTQKNVVNACINLHDTLRLPRSYIEPFAVLPVSASVHSCSCSTTCFARNPVAGLAAGDLPAYVMSSDSGRPTARMAVRKRGCAQRPPRCVRGQRARLSALM